MIVILVESLISCFLFDVPPDLEYHQTTWSKYDFDENSETLVKEALKYV